MKNTSTDNIRERLASAVHESWSHWMQHLFSKATDNPDGSVTIPATFTDRWRRQMKTEYKRLSEQEKESDREQADILLSLFETLEDK